MSAALNKSESIAQPSTANARFAQLDVQQALDMVLLLPADEVDGRFSLQSEVLLLLRQEIHAWIKMLREQGRLVTELLAVSALDQSVRAIAQKLLDSAYGVRSKSWMTMLPTGRQVIILRSSTVQALGFQAICQLAHEQAIRTAQASGQPYNAAAWMHYQSAKPKHVSS